MNKQKHIRSSIPNNNITYLDRTNNNKILILQQKSLISTSYNPNKSYNKPSKSTSNIRKYQKVNTQGNQYQKVNTQENQYQKNNKQGNQFQNQKNKQYTEQYKISLNNKNQLNVLFKNEKSTFNQNNKYKQNNDHDHDHEFNMEANNNINSNGNNSQGNINSKNKKMYNFNQIHNNFNLNNKNNFNQSNNNLNLTNFSTTLNSTTNNFFTITNNNINYYNKEQTRYNTLADEPNSNSNNKRKYEFLDNNNNKKLKYQLNRPQTNTRNQNNPYSGKKIIQGRSYKPISNNHNITVNLRQTEIDHNLNSTSFDYWTNNLRYTTVNNQNQFHDTINFNNKKQHNHNKMFANFNHNQQKKFVNQQNITKSYLNTNNYQNQNNKIGPILQNKIKNVQTHNNKYLINYAPTNNANKQNKQFKQTKQNKENSYIKAFQQKQQNLYNNNKTFKKILQRVQTQPYFQKQNKNTHLNQNQNKLNLKDLYQNFKEQNTNKINDNNQKSQKYNKNALFSSLNQQEKEKLLQKIDWKKDLNLFEKIGQGTFGKVYKAILKSKNPFQQNKLFAIKKVYIDKKYKSRQLQIVSSLNHPNIMKVYNVFTTSQRPQDQYLNIVMDHYPYNLYQVINLPTTENMLRPKQTNQYLSTSKKMTGLQQKLYIYQMLKGLSYIHSNRICHRDIKPHNMLVNEWQLVLCDFGSAKKLMPGESNLSYICSRCYRAPELIFGSSSYTTQIDLWSVGCIILQLINKVPIFIGQNSLDHLLEVIKVLGTPSKQQVIAMNPDYDLEDYQLPTIKRKNLSKIFTKADPLLIDLVNKLLVYSPEQRLTAIDALGHKYFDQIRQRHTFEQIIQNTMVSYSMAASFYNFSQKQTLLSMKKDILKQLLPCWI